jgi:hypothetical protein
MKMERVDLSAEAAAEVRRLAEARTFAADGDAEALAAVEADGTWLAMARRHGIRGVLGSRLLLVWRVAFEDAGGAIVESRLVPAIVELSRVDRGDRHRERIAAIVHELEPRIRPRIEAEAADWRRAVDSAIDSFTSARAARARALASHTGRPDPEAFQPGLFDRRAERARAQITTTAAEAGSAAAIRLAALARSTPISPRAAELLLVLVP